jgi:hypothetical protein
LDKDREAFHAELKKLLKKHDIEPYFFFGSDTAGEFGDYQMTDDEMAEMVLAVLRHDDFAGTAEKVGKLVAEEILGIAEEKPEDDGPPDLSTTDAMKWTAQKG